MAADGPVKPRAIFSDLPPGATFAQDFRVVRPLSSGGMGAVYVVDQLSTRKRRALKVLRPEFVANEGLRRRFLQEAQVSAGIESDHVVEVIGAGVDDASGIPWLAMELLHGYDLESFARRHAPLPAHVLREMFEQLCHALGDAHDKRIIHRDLKPENVFVASPRRAGAPFTMKILDFGIAKALAEVKTQTTDAVGTPLWMSPEQTSPRATVSPASDVWALGLLAFRLATGKIYWLAAHHPELSPVMAIRETLLDPIVPASERAAALGCDPPPPGFDAWFARCVVREVGDRYATARDALDGLRGALGEAGVGPTVTFAFPSTSPGDDGLSNAPTEVDPTKAARVMTFDPTSTLSVLGSTRGRFWIGAALVTLVLVASVVALTIGLRSGAASDDAEGASKRARSLPYTGRVLRDGPSALFRFGDLGELDAISAVEGALTGEAQRADSPFEGGVRFSGGRFEVASRGLVAAEGAVSFEAWIQADAIDEQHRGVLDVESYVDGDYEGYRLYVTNEDGQPQLKFGRAARNVKRDVFVKLPLDGAFHHVVGTFDGETQTCVYLDAGDPGCRDDSEPLPAFVVPKTIVVGNRAGGLGKGDGALPLGETSPGAFVGVIDEVALYPRALDAATVRDHFEGRDHR